MLVIRFFFGATFFFFCTDRTACRFKYYNPFINQKKTGKAYSTTTKFLFWFTVFI
ncbi:MAG: hypothetical protein JWQ84_564 [Mucilaginibacter sp.]|nr:hypothetical protein [Mucilaginibacter sp.]MDB5015732.1 hypothetical protein [Mucilaginibacter sp.]